MTERDRASFVERALARWERPLLAWAKDLVGDPERARDVAQETFLRLCGEAPEAVEPRLPEWLFRVCRNLAIDAQRKDRPMTPIHEIASEPIDARADPARAAAASDESRLVRALLDELPRAQAEALRLKFEHGLGYRDIAGVTGATVTNVGWRIHRGIETLRERLGAAEVARPVGPEGAEA